MRLKTLLPAVLLCAAAVSLQAQITLTSSNMPAPGFTIWYDQIEPDSFDLSDTGNAGANQTWNFTGFPTINIPQPTYFLDLQSTPHPDEYPTAALASAFELSDTTDYTYWDLNSTVFAQLGTVSTTAQISYSQPFKAFQFPTTYQSTFTQTNVGISGTGEGFPISGTASTSVTVDAYGTVTTSLGTFPCLRVKRITELNVTILIFQAIQRDTSWEWWTASYKQPVFTYSRNYVSLLGEEEYGDFALVLTQQTTAAGEPDQRLSVDLRVQPNPVRDAATLAFTLSHSGETSLTIADAQGRIVRQEQMGALPVGEQRQTIDLSGVDAGTYFAILRQEGLLLGVKQLVKN